MTIMSRMNTTDTTRMSITPDTLTATRIRQLAALHRARLQAAGLSEVEAAKLAAAHAIGRQALADAVTILWDQEVAASNEELSSGRRVPRKTLGELWVEADAALEDVRAEMAPPPNRRELAPTAALLEAALAGDDAAAQALRAGVQP